MKKITFKDIFVPTISLFLICIVVSFLLAGTNELTKGPIAEIQAQTAAEAMKAVCPEAQSFDGGKGLEAEFYRGLAENGEVIGYAIPSSCKGYGGDIEVMVGIDLEGKVTGVEILSQSETPGLGANCTKETFKDMYKQSLPEGCFTVVKDGTGGEGGRIDALTGATITSMAVTQAVNNAVDIYNSLEGGKG